MGSLLVRQALEIAEDHRQLLAIRQTVKFLMDDSGNIELALTMRNALRRHRRFHLMAPAPPGLDARLHGRAIRHAVQPTA